MLIKWQPQPRQAQALARTENEILFGGARGGGKTDAGQAWLMYDIDKPYYRALVLRRNADDLKDWVDRARVFYHTATITGQVPEIRFPSRAIIRTGHLKDSNAYTKYQGHEYQKMLIEELTHIPRENDYEKLLGSNRSKYPDIQPQIFNTTNPDGPGYKWVKKRWRIPDYPNDLVITREGDRSRVFIPSKVQDNPILMTADPGYVKFLQSIQNPDLREAWLNGSWAGFSTEGAYYTKQIQQARTEGRITKVPYDPNLKVYTWWDLGVGDSTVILFFQVYGMEWRLIDYHEATGEGLAYYAAVLEEKGYKYADHYAPHDIQVRELGSGKSRLETAKALGINFKVAPNLPIDDGINAVRMRFHSLWIDEEKCASFIEAISQYKKEYNERLGEFKNHPLHDWTSHPADALRYWAVTKLRSDVIPTIVQGGVKPYYETLGI